MRSKNRFEKASRHALAAISLGILAVGACKSPSASDTKHELGVATRRTQPFTCSKKAPEKKLKALHDYAFDHLKRIASANTAIIPAQYNAEGFCLVIEESSEPNASAHPNGTMRVYTGLLKITENDAQFAAVIAHEMAHILQGHSSERIPDEMKDNPEYRQISELLRKHNELASNLEEKTNSAWNDDIKKRGDLIAKYFDIVYFYMSKLSGDPYTSSNQDIYKNIVLAPMPPELEGSSQAYEKRNNWPTPTLRGMAQDARQRILKVLDANKAEEFLALEKPHLDDLSKLLRLLPKISEASRRTRLIMATKTGLAKASNWKEQEADEVGFELYLRAGYDHREYIKMLENLGNYYKSASNQTAGSVKSSASAPSNLLPSAASEGEETLADEIKGTSCQRGTESHPQTCWRMADIKNEWEVHQEFYAQITPKNPAVQVFGDRLSSIKADLEVVNTRRSTDTTESSSPPQKKPAPSNSPTKEAAPMWCDPYQPNSCFPYCRSLASDQDLSGWGFEDGKSCVITGGPVDRRN